LVEAAGNVLGIERENVLEDVGEDRSGPEVFDDVGGRGKGERGHDHLVARTHPPRGESEMKGGRARAQGKRLGHAQGLGHRPLELGHPRPGRQPSGTQDLDDGLHLVLAEKGRSEGKKTATRPRRWDVGRLHEGDGETLGSVATTRAKASRVVR
jgi:hypothetical protein